MSASRATLTALATLATAYPDGYFDDDAVRAAGSTSRTLRRHGLIRRTYVPEVFAVVDYDDPEIDELDSQSEAYGWAVDYYDDWRVAVCVSYRPMYCVA